MLMRDTDVGKLLIQERNEGGLLDVMVSIILKFFKVKDEFEHFMTDSMAEMLIISLSEMLKDERVVNKSRSEGSERML